MNETVEDKDFFFFFGNEFVLLEKTAYFTIKQSSYAYIKLCKHIERGRGRGRGRGQIIVLIVYSKPSFLSLQSDKKTNKKKQNKYH